VKTSGPNLAGDPGLSPERLVLNISWETYVAKRSFATYSGKRVLRAARSQHIRNVLPETHAANRSFATETNDANRSFATSSDTQMLRTARSGKQLGGNKFREPLVRTIFWEPNVAIGSFESSRREAHGTRNDQRLQFPFTPIFVLGILTSFYDYFPVFHGRGSAGSRRAYTNYIYALMAMNTFFNGAHRRVYSPSRRGGRAGGVKWRRGCEGVICWLVGWAAGWLVGWFGP
jgi:hypothetical protein